MDDTDPLLAGDHHVPEPSPVLAPSPAGSGDRPDPLADAHAVLAERIAARRKSLAERRAADQQRAEVDAVLAEYDRPRTRADCAGGPRPCPWASCRYNLLLEVTPDTGRIVLQEREIEDLPETCALDVADRGGLNQPDTAALLGVTRQRVDQLEKRGLRLLAHRGAGLSDHLG